MTKPTFVYDGECFFCRFWVARWRSRVGDAVRFVPFQDKEARPPGINLAVFEESSQFFMSGSRWSGAEGVFRMLAQGNTSGLLFAYVHIPGFRFVSEKLYTLTSSCRVCAWEITKMLFPSAKSQENSRKT